MKVRDMEYDLEQVMRQRIEEIQKEEEERLRKKYVGKKIKYYFSQNVLRDERTSKEGEYIVDCEVRDLIDSADWAREERLFEIIFITSENVKAYVFVGRDQVEVEDA